jgi:hypothetical protein
MKGEGRTWMKDGRQRREEKRREEKRRHPI